MRSALGARSLLSFLALSALPASVWGSNILSSSGFSTCVSDPDVQVTELNVTYDRDTRIVVFDVAGTSTKEQNVTVSLTITAYGEQVYTKTYNPCDSSAEVDFEGNMTSFCPIPAGTFSASGSQTVPTQYADEIPSIAFTIPDLDGDVQLELLDDDGTSVGCVESEINNGQTFQIAAVSYTAAGVAAAALAFSGVSALASGGGSGGSTASPNFGDVIGLFQGMAMNGMLSVQYPKVYQSFTTNFAFSTGLVPWSSMQTAIDNFRQATGGNLTDDNYQYLQDNATLMVDDGSSITSVGKRALSWAALYLRDTTVSVNGSSTSVGTSSTNTTTSKTTSKEEHLVSGLESYVEQLSIPEANTFMTVLLIWAIVVAVIIVSILLVKVILETWSMFGTLPKSLESWRKRYWWRLAKAITNLILLLYGVWTLYCIYQFTNGDSWAAKVLAAVTFSLFTALLTGFTYVIWAKAQQYKKLEGDSSKLYEDKETFIRFGLFYDNYRKNYYWMFIPAIIYMFARGAIVAGANGHGLVQAGGQLIIEAIFLGLLLWTRPYQRKSGRVIGIIIQVVRVLSIAAILVFVDELGISQTTKTITGVALIAVQCLLTGVLAILIAVNALIAMIKENPHTRQRRQAEKLNRDFDDLTPLDARNSLLMEPMAQKDPDAAYKAPLVAASPFIETHGDRYNPARDRSESPNPSQFSRPGRFERDDERLMTGAASMGRRDDSESRSPPPRRDHSRQPRLPDLEFGRAV